MKGSVVIGLGFGDEGKGLVASALCLQSPDTLVVRFGGGHQCGHTVVREDGVRHVFSNFGSGSLHGYPTYWSRFCTLDPVGIMNEHKILKEKGVDPKLFLDPLSMVTTPYDITGNRQEESKKKHGSCGVGFGKTIQRNQDNYKLYAYDLRQESILKIKLNLIKDYYNNQEEDLTLFFEAVTYLFNNIDVEFDRPLASDYYNVVFEGHQGILLDQEFGFFPNVTRSYTTLRQANRVARDIGLSHYNIYYVTRAYQTRHGNGPMTNEDHAIELINNENETNVENEWQGRLRVAPLDLDLLEYSLNCDDHYCGYTASKNIIVTCVDQIKGKWGYYRGGKHFETDKSNIGKTIEIFSPYYVDVYTSESDITEKLNLN